jgi:hypothetical protein
MEPADPPDSKTAGAMGVDIRLPIGLMFAIIGVMLAAFGLFSESSIYERSLGININLIWGTILISFSLVLLWLGSRKRRPD